MNGTRKERQETIAALLHQTAEDHHVAYKETDEVDPDWSIWYAGHLLENGALPHQESDFAFFTKHALCGLFLRFQSAPHFADFLSPKRPEAPIMRFKGQIPGEATRKFSGVLAMVPRTGYCQGRQTWKAD